MKYFNFITALIFCVTIGSRAMAVDDESEADSSEHEQAAPKKISLQPEKLVNPTQEQRDLIGKLQGNWAGAQDTAGEAYEKLRPLLEIDPEVKTLLEKVTDLLGKHGHKTIADIITFCDSTIRESAGGADLYHAEIADARNHANASEAGSWSKADAETKAKKEFSYKILRIGSIDYLMIGATPQVCLQKNQKVPEAYEAVIHELTHFYNIDVFAAKQWEMQLSHFDQYTAHEVNTEGGEFDAFKAGLGAHIRLLKRTGMTRPNEGNEFFDTDGNLTDPETLRSWIMDTYKKIYTSADVLKSLVSDRFEENLWRIKMLDSYATYYGNKNTLMQKIFGEESADLNRINNGLKAQYPTAFK
ncbi:MAG: hypothetical protein ACXVAX_11805 [Pseudobdellovibrio sp.]